jgi:hypothetical protein
MPTPFPGMDPYLERPGLWQEIHTRLIVAIADVLGPMVHPPYILSICMIVISVAGMLSSVEAYDLTDTLALGGVLAGGYQFEVLDQEDSSADEGGGAVVLQPELSFRPTDHDEFFLKLGFAVGNGLNDRTPFTLAPWAADLEDNVKEINGHNRDFVLTAWYKHVFELGQGNNLALSAGLVDATDYLDDNAYANDEYTQFMNEVFTNGPHVFLPSYDIGGVIALDVGQLAFRGVVMNVGENSDGNNFTFFGVQLAYTLRTALGEGTYRILLRSTTAEFLNSAGTDKDMLFGLSLSCDQQLGEIVGAFLRLAWQQDSAAVDFEAVYSGGININGMLWGRSQDNIGIGYAYLDGGNTGIDRTQVFEIYVRFVLNDYVAVTVDLQYMDEKLDDEGDLQGWIPGLRVTAAL